jgi:hypothetical protein
MFDADWEAYGLTYLVLKELMPLKHMRELDEELLACRDVLKGYDGQLQAMLIWYSSKGTELEDKDFAVLNFDQWQELWIDANIPSGTLDCTSLHPVGCLYFV